MKKSEYLALRTFINSEFSGKITACSILIALSASILGTLGVYSLCHHNLPMLGQRELNTFIIFSSFGALALSCAALTPARSNKKKLLKTLNKTMRAGLLSYEQVCQIIYADLSEMQKDMQKKDSEAF